MAFSDLDVLTSAISMPLSRYDFHFLREEYFLFEWKGTFPISPCLYIHPPLPPPPPIYPRHQDEEEEERWRQFGYRIQATITLARPNLQESGLVGRLVGMVSQNR